MKTMLGRRKATARFSRPGVENPFEVLQLRPTTAFSRPDARISVYARSVSLRPMPVAGHFAPALG